MSYESVLTPILFWVYLHSFKHLIYLGCLSVFWIFLFNLKPESKMHKMFTILGFASISAPILFASTYWAISRSTDENLSVPWDLFVVWGEGWFGGIAVVLAWLRYVQPRLNVVLNYLKSSTKLERNSKSDVRKLSQFMPVKALEFDPIKHINIKKGVFVGKDEKHKPVYLTSAIGKSIPHMQVVGTTGSGKGILLGLTAISFMEQGEAVFYLDPKDDEYAPHLLFDAARRTGKPYHFINLNRPNGPQFNLFQGVTEDEAFELFQAGLGLTATGGPEDFYSIADRREAGITAKLMAEKGLNIAQVYAERSGTITAEKFEGRLRELAEMPSINALDGKGVDLAKVIDEGGCVYVVGSMRNDIVKTVQRILLVRLFQLAERRDRIKGGVRPIAIVLDELKYHLSRPALEGLGAARDKGVHLVLAHQSLGDIRDVTKDLNPDAVVDAVVENTRYKFAYRVMSPDTAEWMARMSGEIQVDDETRRVKRNFAQSEIVDSERNIRQSQRYFIDTNQLLNLPAGVAVMYGDGLPKFVSIQPLKVKKSEEAVKIALVEGTSALNAIDAIALDNQSSVSVKSEAAKTIDLNSFDDMP